MDANRNDQSLWEEYRRIIAGHIHPGHDVIDTVNRLLRKSPWFTDPTATPQISRNDLSIIEDSWSLSLLWQLIHSKQITANEPTSVTGAILTLRCHGKEYLMDGRRRINHWHRNNAQGPHRVLILCAPNDA
jgi:hypothetical protein